MADLLTNLCTKLGTSIDARGRAHATCPRCGAEPTTRSGGRAFHFYVYEIGGKSGACCWACGAKWSLRSLAAELAVGGTYTPSPPRPRVVPPWELAGALEQYRKLTAARIERVVAAWQGYKPLSRETIERYDLGVGHLPIERDGKYGISRHQKLLLPLFHEGRLVGFTGRAFLPEDGGPKWITASGSDLTHLYGVERVRAGQQVVICENRVDAILASQYRPDTAFVAVGGARWDERWTAELKARRPGRVVVWLDHDLAGNGSRYHEREMLAAWRARQEEKRRDNPALADKPWPTPPERRGPMIANALLEAGMQASLYVWPRGTPAKQDLGAEIMRRLS